MNHDDKQKLLALCEGLNDEANTFEQMSAHHFNRIRKYIREIYNRIDKLKETQES